VRASAKGGSLLRHSSLSMGAKHWSGRVLRPLGRPSSGPPLISNAELPFFEPTTGRFGGSSPDADSTLIASMITALAEKFAVRPNQITRYA